MKKVVTFGEALLRFSTPNFLRFEQTEQFTFSVGGEACNIAASLANWEIPVAIVTSLPQNSIANMATNHLRKQGVETRDIVRSKGRMGMYFWETSSTHRDTQIVCDREYSAFSQIRPGIIDWDKVFENACWFHWSGKIPTKGTLDVLREAIAVAQKRNILVSCDLHDQKKLWSDRKESNAVMSDLLSNCSTLR